jgi:hypothetical protein
MKYAVGLIVLSGLLAAGAVQDTPASAANGRVYADAVGEVSCCTRDISEVRVTNDDAGRITFTVIAGPDLNIDDDDDLGIQIDADLDRSTGNEEGIDYVLAAHVLQGQIGTPHFSRWTREFDFIPAPSPGMRVSATGNVFRLRLDRHALADTDRFRFRVGLHEVSSIGGAYSELAPDLAAGMWEYRVGIALARIRPALTVPASAKAGKRLVARLGLRVAGGPARLASGRISCRAFVDGRRLPVARREFVARRALCEWQIPRTTRGELVRGAIGVQVTGELSSFVGLRFRARITS